MQNKKEMNIGVAVVICLALIGFFIFISINKKTSMTDNNVGANTQTSNDQVAKAGDSVSMNYTGRLADGTVFDSSVDPKFGHVEPYTFTLGQGTVIAGWEEGIVGMKVGEKKTLVIPPEKAYGPNAYGPIPANSTLTFDVELVSINK
jgi:FKBP-type peptidyl-prolyl cis-trans isomerase